MKEVTIEFSDAEFRKLEKIARLKAQSVPVFVAGMFTPLDLQWQPARKQNDFSPQLTAAQVKKQRRELERDIKTHHKRTSTARLAELRRAIGEAKKSAKPRRQDAVALCGIGRQMAKERAKKLRIEGREAIRQAIEQEKVAARKDCDERKAKIRFDVDAARAALREEKLFQREIKRIDSSAKARERKGPSASERRQESDDEVRANVPPDLVPLFEQVKRTIKASDRMSRTESFLHYVEEHPAEVYAAIEAESVRELARLEREAAKEHRALRRRGVSASELAAIPF